MQNKLFFRKIINYFFRGLLLVVPITVMIYIVVRLFIFLDHLIPTKIPGLGLAILLVTITFLGFLGSSFIAQPAIDYANKMLDKMPLIKTIYTAISDLMSAFVGTKKSFTRPVLVKMNRESDIEKLGFVTTEDLTMLHIHSGKVAVYMPHSYNFSGNLFIVPVENVTPVNVNTGEFMKFIVSGGVTDVGQSAHEEEL